jgi:PHD/YefM family antitoxin component YafN of YafNO toxin-antitoxin module
MSWEIEEAQQHFRDLLQAVEQEPQLIYRQDQLVAVLVEAEIFQEFLQWQQQHTQRSLFQAFTELHQICEEENYALDIPQRGDRSNPFA